MTAHMERIPAKDLEGNWSMVTCFGCAAQRFNLKATDDDHLQLNGCCSVWCCLCLPQCSTLTRIEGTNNFKSGGKGDPLSFASADAQRVGCVGFMSPETYREQPCTAAVDVFSLGVMIHVLLRHVRLPQNPRRA